MRLTREVNQFFIMLYKGLLLRKRHFIITGFELLLPILIAIIPVLISSSMSNVYIRSRSNFKNSTVYPPFDPYKTGSGTYSNVVILYAPISTAGKTFMESATDLWKTRVGVQGNVHMEGYTTKELMEERAKDIDKNTNDYVVGTFFSNMNSKSEVLPTSLDYTIRIGGAYSSSSFHIKDRFRYMSPYVYEAYRETFFLSWQAAVEQTFIASRAKDPESMSYNVMMQRFPFPEYQDSSDFDYYFMMVQSLTVYAFIVSICILAKRLVDEKANHSRELLRMMGMTDCVYFTSSFLNAFAMAFISAIFIVILYKIPVADAKPFSIKVLVKSDGFLFFSFLLVYITSVITMVMAVTRFVNKAVWAVILTLIVFIVPYSVMQGMLFAQNETYMGLSSGVKMAICLHPNGAMMLMFKLISMFETRGNGISWDTLTTYIFTENVNVAEVMAMMLVSIVVYCVIIWYVDAVWPWQDGVPKPLYFPFTKWYWCGHSSAPIEDAEMINDSDRCFEPDPVGTTPGIIVRHLKKNFRAGFTTKTVVNDLSLNVYSGQITALLGQNGAGKTTTINVLTGLYVPDGGSAAINGYDVRTQTIKARQSLGICPQENILYDTLTVREHLQFFAGIKGTPFGMLSQVANETLSIVGLGPAANTLANRLSGGMKRKLSLAIAIVGGSKVLFLDEPTSGLDPESRRVVWDILLGIRQDRTIVLTTHYMEEADVLGDRIAIMASGKLRCCGSPMFLKRQFGAGYSLNIVKGGMCQPDKITDLLKSFVEECSLVDNTDAELSYSFPSETPGSVFGKMFLQLENDFPNLGIASYGMTVTTMDDVFLKVASLEDDPLLMKELNGRENGKQNDSNERSFLITDMRKVSSWQLLINQLLSLLAKRFHYAKRFYGILVAQIIIPFLLVLLMAYLLRSLSSSGDETSSLKLDPRSVYNDIQGFYSFNGSGSNFMKKYVSTLQANAITLTNVKNPEPYILDTGKNHLYTYLRQLMFGGSGTEGSNSSLNLYAWYNTLPYHALPMSLNLMHTALLRYYSGEDGASISLTNSPFPDRDRTRDYMYSDMSSMLVLILASIFFPLALTFLSAVYIYVPVIERVTKAKLLQLLTGLNEVMYWFGMFLWDMFSHFVVCVVLLIPFLIFSTKEVFTVPEAGGSIFLLLMLFGWCCIPICYVFSHVFKSSTTGFSVLMALNLMCGIIPTPVISAMFSNAASITLLAIVWVLRILLPMFTASWGLTKALKVSYANTFCDSINPEVLQQYCNTTSSSTLYSEMSKCCKNICGLRNNCFKKSHPLGFDNEAAGIDALVLFLLGCIYVAFLFLLESGLLGRLYDNICMNLFPRRFVVSASPFGADLQEDPDVAREAERVQVLGPSAAIQDALAVLGLTKNYRNLCAVDNLTFAVHNEECFGLLGVNGAGKTSTFKMLTGDIRPTRGNAYIGAWGLQTNLKKFQSFLGYCPQFDPLIDRLTGREMLNLFAALRALAWSSAPRVVDEIIKSVGLEEHANKETRLYSGGNKRKLSLALAIIGSPAVILLDEPTSGVDPVSRRKIWNILEKVREISGSSVILCSHSMEECENLCDRLAIMVNGRFRCLGSIQQLKSTFGQGYMVTIKPRREVETNEEVMNQIISYFQSVFPQSILRDKNQGNLQLHITDTSVPWSRLFITMEDMKHNFNLEDYLISGTTLEQIFLSFARSQRISAQHI